MGLYRTEFDLLIRPHSVAHTGDHQTLFQGKLEVGISGIIYNGGTSILSSIKLEFPKKEFSEISGSISISSISGKTKKNCGSQDSLVYVPQSRT